MKKLINVMNMYIPLEEEGKGCEKDGGNNVAVGDHDEGAHARIHGEFGYYVEASEANLHRHHGQRGCVVSTHHVRLTAYIYN
jgi:hypothetical protein